MKKTVLIFSFILSGFFIISAQDHKNDILMTIAGRDITLGEFERIYMKNNNDNVVQKQSLEEYLDMFINFKLKVIEAEELGKDTLESFLKEFNSYKKQLAKPYMTNPDITEEFAKEAYERMKKEVLASHILLSLAEDASPEDTLYVYEKLMNIRQRILDGEDFESLARATSEDPSAKTNGGLLGWFSVFRMVYDFESAAFNTPKGEVSMPIRTRFGMHIIKVDDLRDAKGSRKVAHIFIRAPKSMSDEDRDAAKIKAFALTDSLNLGVDFGDLARRHSEDRSSAESGGEIPWLVSGQMIPVFDQAVFSLENPGDVSEAIQSDYGWHIIKLLDKKLVGSYEDEKAEILLKIKQGDRNAIKDEAFIKDLKKEYNFSFNEENFRKLLNQLDASIFEAGWKATAIAGMEEEELFSIDHKRVTLGEFAAYLEKQQRKQNPAKLEVYAREKVKAFEKQEILDFEENNLLNKYEDFRNILQEYHDGILLFDLTDELVWSKAVSDSAGLEAYYEQNRNNYKWGERVNAFTITVNDSLITKDVRKLSAKLIKKGQFSAEALYKSFCPEDSLNSCLTIKEDKYEKGDDEKVDATKWKKGVGSLYTVNSRPSFVVITDLLSPSLKELKETRGLVTADYQKFLEDKWVESLREKYSYNVNKELLKYIKE
ncbi:MAG: peptidylprolyl isomerase [Bacteroidales bacterium]|nr:peptidylprolyl isomerase [Bacteroidales bacterium]MCF8391191.1 peptidylprolyl isomerase [Bacteroidales bacterium]